METKKKTHIADVRKQRAENAQKLQEKFGSDVYWNVFLDVGLMFLESEFGRGSEWYCFHRSSEMFWNWFNNEFKLNENALLNTKMLHEIDELDFKANCLQLVAYPETHHSFYCGYLKNITQSRKGARK